MEVRAKFGEVVPFVSLVIIEGCTIGLTIMAKTIITNGLSPVVFVVYTSALVTIILLPYSFISSCKNRIIKKLLTFIFLKLMLSLANELCRITLTQNLTFMGLRYSSPILVCAMGHLIPAFNFLLSVVLRKTKFDWRSTSVQVKVIGTLISIMGAILVEFFKGPLIRNSSDHQLQHSKQLFIYSTTSEHWVLGGILLAAASLSVALWNTVQMGAVQKYPEAMKVLSYYSLLGTIQCAIVSFMVERDPSAWKLQHNMEILVIVLTALFGGVIRSHVHMWCLHLKGPSYVPLFKPFGIAFASTFGVTFFANSLHYGSVIGAAITGMGYYTVMWGKFRGDEENIKQGYETSDSSDKKVPLLQGEMEV
ncbi:WAT1-related protein [Quillaja saponaria]|uniref:WAT1-related protein n=1 Tax=Quillaja saponaria TaxID=32244 RepID=A0AAD7L941_QUISA|nr:WAT1-related protein [Quillaja saponaria]